MQVTLDEKKVNCRYCNKYTTFVMKEFICTHCNPPTIKSYMVAPNQNSIICYKCKVPGKND